MHRLFTIVEEHTFRIQLRKIKPDARRADDFVEGVKWLLARDPLCGMQLSPNTWFLPNNVPEGVPTNIYYTFDEDTVYLMRIEIADI